MKFTAHSASDPADCDCPAHRRHAIAVEDEASPAPRESHFSSILPALACAVCPACIASYSSALSAVGISATLGEAYHHHFLAVAMLVTLGLQSHRAYRTRRLAPLAIAALGCALLMLGHLLDEMPVLVWGGVAVLLGGSVVEVLRARRRAAASAT